MWITTTQWEQYMVWHFAASLIFGHVIVRMHLAAQ